LQPSFTQLFTWEGVPKRRKKGKKEKREEEEEDIRTTHSEFLRLVTPCHRLKSVADPLYREKIMQKSPKGDIPAYLAICLIEMCEMC